MLRPLTDYEKSELKKPRPASKNELKLSVRQEKLQEKKSRRNAKRKKIVKLESLKQIQSDAAGLDIGATEIFACVPEDRDTPNVRSFGTFTVELHELADWLEQCGVKSIAMESTGVYWIPAFEILTSRGFEVNLINARQIKNVPGKKTDVLDCQWIQQLHSYGLLRSSFRPTDDLCSLRALVRHREMLTKYRSIHIQHIQKSLELMNLKLCSVLKDITGKTGMQIIRAILDGERDCVQLAKFRDPRCTSSQQEIAKALEGNYRIEHLFSMRQAVELYDQYSRHIELCDMELEKNYSVIKCQKSGCQLPPLPKKRVKKIKDKPQFELRTYLYELCGVDLTDIDGIDVLTAQTVTSEIGLDMSKWKTVKHFTSWLGLCPCNKISGGKILMKFSKKITNRATLALKRAARSLHSSKSALGAFYRRMRAKHGPMKASMAAAHKMARIIYSMLKTKKAYVDPGEQHYLEKYRNRITRNLKRKAAQLGFELTPFAA
jgi:transposase